MLKKQKRLTARKAGTNLVRKVVSGLVKTKRRGVKSAGLQEQKIKAPSIGSAIRTRLFGFRFGRAAPNDLYPEGGLRIAGTLPGNTGSGGWGVPTGNSTNVALTPGSAASPVYAMLVSPTAPATPTVGALFSSTGPLAVFSAYFRRFRFRRLEIDYSSSINTASTDNRTLQFSYDPDAFAAEGVVYSMASAVCTNTVEFPSWTPSMHWPAINDRKTSDSDELYYLTTAGDAVTAQAANVRMISQGAIIGVSSLPTVSASAPFGRTLLRFEVDLYGFENGGNGALPSEGGFKRSFSAASRMTAEPQSRPPSPDFVDVSDRKSLPPLRTLEPVSVRSSSKK